MSSFDMFVLRRDLRWMFPLLFLGGVLSNMCKVKFEQQHICAVRGSSVVILCSFYNSDRKTLNRFSWGHVKPNQTKARLISGSKFRKVVEQFEFVGDGDQNCSLKIQQVEPKYAGKYFLRVANSKTRCINRSLMLIVVDLKILLFSSNEDGTIKEGDSVTLSCTNSCDGDNPSSVFTWFKNGEPINEGKVLDFRNISFANSGNYSCSLKTQRGTTSGIRRV
uniref:Ig-like domain-containing protein n=2 Tax=Kryptolebias marmoratus TaxID=37003 RepID=A0A3Q3AB48_KRYMA